MKTTESACALAKDGDRKECGPKGRRIDHQHEYAFGKCSRNSLEVIEATQTLQGMAHRL